MRFYVEPSPAGGYYVKLTGHAAPVSRHDTEEEAEERVAAYVRGAAHDVVAEGEREDRPAGPRPRRFASLGDGTQLLVRAVRPEDKPLFVAGFDALSEESRRRRFAGATARVSIEELVAFTEFDTHDEEAVGAIDPSTGDGVGVARYVRRPEQPATADVAVAVIDEWQRRGVGVVLLEELAARAARRGVRRFAATELASGAAMARLLARLGAPERRVEGDMAHVEVELA